MSVYDTTEVESDESTDNKHTCSVCGERAPPNEYSVTLRASFDRVVTANAEICLTCAGGLE